MGNADTMQLIGMGVTLAVFVAIGLLSGKLVKTKEDFYVAGGSFGALSVAGAASGTYIGGGTVIGTAQLAFTDGFSAMYFAIGCCCSMLLTALVFSAKVRDSGKQTIQEMVLSEFGPSAGLLATLLGILALYINNISHLFSGISLIGSVFPDLSVVSGAIITAALIFVCACLGGFWGMSLINILKTTILLSTAVISAAIIFVVTGNLSDIAAAVPERFFTFCPRGAGTDLGNLVSVMLGILSSQTTIQAVFSARSNRDCRRGFLMGAILLPVAGISCSIIGAYMRTTVPDLEPLQAFPYFVLTHTNGLLSGVILATTMIAVASAGVSIMLGIAGIVVNNLYLRFRPNAGTREQLGLSRLVILCCLCLSTFIISKGVGNEIMQYNFLSMGMRCTVLFMPMCAFLFFPGRVSRRCAIASIAVGPVALLLGKFAIPLPFDCIFFALAVCAAIMLLGVVDQKLINKSQIGDVK
ncbi:MAG: sodium:solute symporter family protein [Candidatus Heteroscillospira sp.]|jgi:SSS family solute:Na+ symporter